jgi:hypothetical protein
MPSNMQVPSAGHTFGRRSCQRVQPKEALSMPARSRTRWRGSLTVLVAMALGARTDPKMWFAFACARYSAMGLGVFLASHPRAV